MDFPTIKNPSWIANGVECIGKWGHGRAAGADFARMPGVLIADGGDGWSYAYRRPGWTMQQLAKAVAPLFAKSDMVVRHAGNSVWAEPAPADFWIEKDDEFTPNLAAHPDVIVY